MVASRPDLRRALLAAAAVCALVLVAFAYRPAADAAFIWDDHVLVERDAPYKRVPLARLFTSSFWPASPLSDARAHYYYRPIVLLSYRADLALGGTPEQLHRTNIALHLLACALLAVAALRGGARSGAAIVAALVWGLAPRLTEAVAWIAGRTDVLATVFGLAAICVTPGRAEGARLRWPRAAGAALFLLLALCSKEVAIAFAVALLFVARDWRERAIVTGAPVATWIVLRSATLTRDDQPLRDLGARQRAATVLETIFRYVEMTFDALRPRTSIGMLGAVDPWRAVGGGVVLVAVAVIGYRAMRRGSPGVRTGVAMSLASLALVVHVIPFALSGAVAADRLLYVPLAGLAITLAVSARAARRSRALGAAALALALLFVPATRARAADYRDEGVFWVEAAEAAHPANSMPLRALAGHVEAAGEPELACRLLRRARTLSSSPSAGPAAARLTIEGYAHCLVRTGHYDEALALLEDLAAQYPDHARIRMEVGFARLHALDFDGAAAGFDKSVALDNRMIPLVVKARRDLSSARDAATRFADEEARRADPYGYASFLGDVGHVTEADAAFTRVALDPAADPRHREQAAEVVLAHGSIPHATAVAAQDPRWAARFEHRLRRHDALVPLLPRIERLAPDARP